MNAEEYKIHYEKMKADPQYKEEYIAKRKQSELDYVKDQLENGKYFIRAEDVPNLPVVDKEEWNKYYVPMLIKRGAVPKAELKDGTWYYGDFRNSQFGLWDKEKEQFKHLRYKFGYMWDTCEHFEDDRGFAVFVPIREAKVEEINNLELIIKGLDTRSREEKLKEMFGE